MDVILQRLSKKELLKLCQRRGGQLQLGFSGAEELGENEDGFVTVIQTGPGGVLARLG